MHELRCIRCLLDVYAKATGSYEVSESRNQPLGLRLCHYVAAMGTSAADSGRASSKAQRLQNVLTSWLLSTRSRTCESSKRGVIDVEVAVLDRCTLHRNILRQIIVYGHCELNHIPKHRVQTRRTCTRRWSVPGTDERGRRAQEAVR